MVGVVDGSFVVDGAIRVVGVEVDMMTDLEKALKCVDTDRCQSDHLDCVVCVDTVVRAYRESQERIKTLEVMVEERLKEHEAAMRLLIDMDENLDQFGEGGEGLYDMNLFTAWRKATGFKTREEKETIDAAIRAGRGRT